MMGLGFSLVKKKDFRMADGQQIDGSVTLFKIDFVDDISEAVVVEVVLG